MYCNATDGNSYTFWAENDDAWVDLNSADILWEPGGFNWINNKQEFIWISEKDGWRHIYKISKDGKIETLLTSGKFDIEAIKCIDEKNNYIYFSASPNNATQLYLYRVKINAKGSNDAELITNVNLKGKHKYTISPTGKFASHTFSNHQTPAVTEWLTLPENKVIKAGRFLGQLFVPLETSIPIIFYGWLL